MTEMRKVTSYILLMSAFIWSFCRCVPSNMGSDCEYNDSQTTYSDLSSECPNGATGLRLCEPGQKKIRPCINADEDTSNICEGCPEKFFQANFNRCTSCHECSECDVIREQIENTCTRKLDTVCKNLITETATTSEGSTTIIQTASITTQSSVVKTTTVAESQVTTEVTWKEEGLGNVSDSTCSKSGLSQAGLIAIVVLSVTCVFLVLALVVTCLIWKSKKHNPGVNQASSSSGTGSNRRRDAGAQQEPNVPANQAGGSGQQHNPGVNQASSSSGTGSNRRRDAGAQQQSDVPADQASGSGQQVNDSDEQAREPLMTNVGAAGSRHTDEASQSESHPNAERDTMELQPLHHPC